MKIVCENQSYRTALKQEFPGFEETMLASHVADVFNVSQESAKIRIRQLGLGFDKVAMPSKSIFTIGYPSKVFSL